MNNEFTVPPIPIPEAALLPISQTLIKDVIPVDACPLFVYYRHVEHKPTMQSDLMLQGNYFEHHVIGACRDGKEPVIPKLTKGGMSAEEKVLVERIAFAKDLLERLGVDVAGGEKQVEILTDEKLLGHIDLITNDFQQPDRKAIYDLKWTATKYDDRWNGWADFEHMVDQHIQARHYVLLCYLKYGVFMPYYFLVFGKSGWVRIIKVLVTRESMIFHERHIEQTNNRLLQWEEAGWPAVPDFKKCMDCDYHMECPHAALLPTVEQFKI
jgi:hypothetical protein